MDIAIDLDAARPPIGGPGRLRRLGATGSAQRITILNGRARDFAAAQPCGAFSLKWIPTGAAVYRVDRTVHRLSGDALLLLNAGQAYEVEFTDRGATESFCVFYSDALLADAIGDPPPFPDLVFHPDRALATTLIGLRARFDDTDLAAPVLEEQLLALLDRLVGIAAEHRHLDACIPAANPATRRRLAARLRRARDMLEATTDHVPTLDELAAVGCLSKFHLVRLFRAAFGCTPMRYAEACRIARAVPLLWRTRLTVTEVAAAVGYDSPSAFIRAFRRQHGVTPRVFRANG